MKPVISTGTARCVDISSPAALQRVAAVGIAILLFLALPLGNASGVERPALADFHVKISGNIYLLALTYYAGTMCAEVKREDEAKFVKRFSDGLKADLATYSEAKRNEVRASSGKAKRNAVAYLLVSDAMVFESSEKLAKDTARLWKREFGCSSSLAKERIDGFILLLQDLDLSQKYLDEYLDRPNRESGR